MAGDKASGPMLHSHRDYRYHREAHRSIGVVYAARQASEEKGRGVVLRPFPCSGCSLGLSVHLLLADLDDAYMPVAAWSAVAPRG